jgi:hypothetical protein
MNLNTVNQADDLFRRYDLIGIMNRLRSMAVIDQYVGPNGFCPIRPANSTTIRIDYSSGPGDLPKPHGPTEAVREVLVGNYGQREMHAPYWRGRYSIDERTITEMRELGEDGSQQGRVGYRAITDRLMWARESTDYRIAQTACQALYGEIDLYYDEASQITLNYQHPAHLRLDLTATGNTDWREFDAAAPLDDIGEMKDRLYRWGAMDPGILLMGANVRRNLIQCEQYKDYVKQTGEGVRITATGEMATETFLDLVPVVAKGTYPLIDRFAADYTSGTTITLERGDEGSFAELAEGDQVKIDFSTNAAAANREAQEMATVDTAAVSGKTLTITAALDKDYQAGDQLIWHRPFIGWNDVFILPMAGPGEWMQWRVAQSSHANFESERYAMAHRVDPPVPEQWQIFFGIDGIPVFLKKNQHAYIKTSDDAYPATTE